MLGYLLTKIKKQTLFILQKKHKKYFGLLLVAGINIFFLFYLKILIDLWLIKQRLMVNNILDDIVCNASEMQIIRSPCKTLPSFKSHINSYTIWEYICKIAKS